MSKGKGKAKRKENVQIGNVQTAQIEQAQTAGSAMDEENAKQATAVPETGSAEADNVQAAGPAMDEENAMQATAIPGEGSAEADSAQTAGPAMDEENAMQEQPQVQLIDMNKIVASEYNPRKKKQEETMLELADSIRQVGVLQPICVRPKNEGYEIVYGERRFWAAAMAGLNYITAIVRDMSDDEAEDAAITENLQREDVKPMEEAAAYDRALRTGRHTVETLVEKFGKSEAYIRSRLKLCELIEPMAELLDREDILVGVAIEIAKYDAAVQQEVYAEHFSEGCNRSWKNVRRKEIAQRLYERYMTKLSSYRFDKTECNTCQHNTANQVLFVDACEGGCAGCQNRECMIRKNEEYLCRTAVKLLKEDPRTTLAEVYNSPAAVIEQLTKEGYHVEKLEYAFHYGEGPKKPEEPKFEDFESEEDFAEAKENYEADLASFTEETKELEFQITEGRVRKYAIIGQLDVNIRYEVLADEEKSVTIDDEQGERQVLVTVIPPSPVEGLRQQDQRNRQLCYEHITEELKRVFREAKVTNKPLQKEEQQMFHYAIMKKVRNVERLKRCGFRPKEDLALTTQEVFACAGRITPKQQAALMRTFLLDFFREEAPSYRCTDETLDTRLMCRFADLNIPEQSQAIQQEYILVYEKRKARLQEQIEAIEAQREMAEMEESAEEPYYDPEELPQEAPAPDTEEPQPETEREPMGIPIEPDTFEPDEMKIAA